MVASSRTRSSSEQNYLRELTALALIAVATLLALSLVSYDPLDDSLFYRNPSSAGVRNYIGPVGANIAALLFQILGYTAYLLPATIFVLGGCLALRIGIPAAVTKTVGVAGLALSSSTALSLLFPQLMIGTVAHQFPGGGVLGGVLVESARSAFSDLALYIISFTGIGISLLLTFHFSFGTFFRWIGSGLASRFRESRSRKAARSRARKGAKSSKGSKPLVVVRLKMPWRRRKEAAKGRVRAGGLNARGGRLPAEAAEEETFLPVIALPRQRRRRRGRPADKRLPPTALLNEPPPSSKPLNLQMLAEQARVIVKRYREFGIDGEVLQTNPGPVVHTFEFKPAAGVKYSKVVGLSDELCLALKAVSVRINRLPGKSTIGIEVPNPNRELIHFRELVESPELENSRSPLTLALGKLINGDSYVTDLVEMPHLLIAGATGTGKSVSIHSMICSILYKALPEEVKFILIDTKQVELSYYNGIPHLLTPVVVSPKQAANALRWACKEMESRYKRLAAEGARNIEQFNRIAAEAQRQYSDLGEDEEAAIEPLPYIVIAIDELADLMIAACAEVEESICRLAQKARAIGIHLIVATQRPSVDVLTGVIKANFQCRMSFRVATKVDSRTILDCNGAETLLGNGDMLFLPPRTSRLIRLHSPFICDKEVMRVVDFWRDENSAEADEAILSMPDSRSGRREDLAPAQDPLYEEAVNLVLNTGTASISNLQRKMRLGYARAARIIDTMEAAGIIGPADGSKPRQILKRQLS